MHWITQRIVRSVVTFLLVLHLSFFAIQKLPGGPMDYLMASLAGSGANVNEEEVAAIAEAYLNVNPNKPIEQQYVEYMTALVQGDLGTSIWYQSPVTEILANALPWTVFVMAMATALMFVIGVVLGALMAYAEGSRFDSASSIVSIVMNSVPYYVLGIVAVFVLGYQLDLVPLTGKMNQATTPGLNLPFIVGVYQHAFLPVISVVLTGFGGLALTMRGNSIQVLGSDFLRVGRLRGLPSRRIATRYVGRNAILPIYTSLMIRLGAIFGGSVVLERIFVYRGVGFYLFKAVEIRDYPLLMGGVLMITFTVITSILVAELTYGRIDPRAQEGGAHEAH